MDSCSGPETAGPADGRLGALCHVERSGGSIQSLQVKNCHSIFVACLYVSMCMYIYIYTYIYTGRDIDLVYIYIYNDVAPKLDDLRLERPQQLRERRRSRPMLGSILHCTKLVCISNHAHYACKDM